MARNNTETKEAANSDEKSKGQAEAGRWDAPGDAAACQRPDDRPSRAII